MEVNNVPTNILPYLTEIAERLWTGHASVMVGAGFSKNAINFIKATQSPPNWVQLGNFFYEKLYGKLPDENARYLNLLKLAEEFEATYGRSSLEHFIHTHIADTEYEPSDLHKMLMELPWTDVFTTNYDTLLERSCRDVLSRKYDVVLNQNDLVYSNRPRIIKLHGSFPSERPLIITEEDYRIYPKKYAAFVNTVQQSLLENTLCLIGFSGDDPNFLQWLGWINDNIGKENAPKIYLIGVLNLSESQKKLLNHKNIISVDLSSVAGIENDHKKGIEFFIEYLSKQRIRRDNLNWPIGYRSKRLSLSEKDDVAHLITDWSYCREMYPNWLILPREQRETLWIYTQSFSNNESIFQQLADFQDIDYIYELNWRLERCLIPIWNNMAPHFQSILDKYNLFPDEIKETREINIQEKGDNLDLNAYRDKWIQVSLSLLRFYREENFREQWTSVYNSIESVKNKLAPDQLACLYYEQILDAIFKMEYEYGKTLLYEWPQNSNSLFWSAKKAMLIAEFGQLREAESILESVLTDIRKKLNLSPIGNDYNWVSQEAYVMFLLNLIQRNLKGHYLSEEAVTFSEFNERWNDLLQYKSDPWGEKDYFDLMLKKLFIPNQDISIKNEFEIGRITRSYSSAGTSQESIIAYTFFRYLEELAIPLSLSTVNFEGKTINGSLERIISISSNWAITILNRYWDYRGVNVVFDRKYLNGLSTNVVDNYIKLYLEKFDVFFPLRESDPIARSFIDKVPAIFARLCTKCSETSKMELYNFYQKISKTHVPLKELNKFLCNLIDSSSKSIKEKAIELLINTPILDPKSVIAQTIFYEPFDYLRINQLEDKIRISPKLINSFIQMAMKNNGQRKNALKRLLFLHLHNLLNKNDINRLFKAIWAHRDEHSGFPVNTPYYKFAFLSLPHPKNIDVNKLFKTYIESNLFNVQGIKKEKGVGMGNGYDSYAEELLGSSKTINNPNGIEWNNEELEAILSKCEEWWKFDKKYITEGKYKDRDFGPSIHEEFQARFKNLNNIVARVLGEQRNNLSSSILKRIKTLVMDMDNCSVPMLKSIVVFELSTNADESLRKIQSALISQKRTKVVDALEAILLTTKRSYDSDTNHLTKVLNIIEIPLKWNMVSLLPDIFDTVTNFIQNTKDTILPIQNSILSSLEYVLNIGEDIPLEDYLLLKRKAIKVASLLYNIHEESNHRMPKILLDWKSVAMSENEYDDIKNRWKIGA